LVDVDFFAFGPIIAPTVSLTLCLLDSTLWGLQVFGGTLSYAIGGVDSGLWASFGGMQQWRCAS
jgi:hypothetical protein